MAKIMVVDDAAFMRMVIKDILTKNGHDVVAEAGDGLDAIEKYKESKPDLVFLDIVMPNMEGTDALKRIMEIDENAKVVMCSSIGQQSIVTEAINNGAQDFIVKPFDANKVLEVISKVM
ncbi:response regulator [Methanosalsum natronophilum]|uniref:Response regulator n=1 Tax=Methanosalsum natronophilum TaxID=768733 RepID=A0A3R8CCN5_9EURY|nr:response regulator [Methanosalsum natronophilum]MCS3922979.1 two-component system chemotaxis response regulator CheY [Methanosalsum natronophilum]RQD85342.1 MAG: response regulator [Methanosalsum natronophilum]